MSIENSKFHLKHKDKLKPLYAHYQVLTRRGGLPNLGGGGYQTLGGGLLNLGGVTKPLLLVC